MAFAGDGQHPGDERCVVGCPQGGAAEQEVDCRQSGVAGGHAVFSVGPQVLEEGADQWCVQVAEVQLGGVFAGVLEGVAQQQREGVPVGGHGVWAGQALGHQPVGEERLQDGSKDRHGRARRLFSRRWAARASSSGGN
jgi:hypothetical protein